MKLPSFLRCLLMAGAFLPRLLFANIPLTVDKLKTYCKACHAVGELRFILNDDAESIWNTILTERSPLSGRLWKDAILEVLNWPSDDAPPFDKLMDPPDRDWMPKGVKRIYLSEDKVNGISARRIILETLKSAY